eukprot:6186605-Pleurochrysis_carterae.AAC.4
MEAAVCMPFNPLCLSAAEDMCLLYASNSHHSCTDYCRVVCAMCWCALTCCSQLEKIYGPLVKPAAQHRRSDLRSKQSS